MSSFCIIKLASCIDKRCCSSYTQGSYMYVASCETAQYSGCGCGWLITQYIHPGSNYMQYLASIVIPHRYDV